MKRLQSLGYILVNFILTRMVPFSMLSPGMNLFTFVMLCNGLIAKKHSSIKNTIFTGNIIYLTVALFFSVALANNSPANALRTYLLLIIVLFAYFITVSRNALRWFFYFNILQAVIIIVASIVISILYDISSYLPIRHFVQSQEWGDLYTYNGYFYIVQIKGNALLLFALMLLLSPFGKALNFKCYKLMVITLLASVFVAGNFAYLIVLFIYLLFWYLNSFKVKLNIKILTLVLLLIALTYPVAHYVSDTLTSKEGSLGTRQDQIEVLGKDLNEDVFSLIIGRGLGHTIDTVTSIRDYTGQVYYELQTLYVLNQLGIVMFILYFISHCLLAYVNYKDNVWIVAIYLGYIVYASSNPYILDTNQFVVIVTLNSIMTIKSYGRDKKQDSSIKI